MKTGLLQGTVLGYLAVVFVLYWVIRSWTFATLGGLLLVLGLYFAYPKGKGMIWLVLGAVVGLLLAMVYEWPGRRK